MAKRYHRRARSITPELDDALRAAAPAAGLTPTGLLEQVLRDHLGLPRSAKARVVVAGAPVVAQPVRPHAAVGSGAMPPPHAPRGAHRAAKPKQRADGERVATPQLREHALPVGAVSKLGRRASHTSKGVIPPRPATLDAVRAEVRALLAEGPMRAGVILQALVYRGHADMRARAWLVNLLSSARSGCVRAGEPGTWQLAQPVTAPTREGTAPRKDAEAAPPGAGLTRPRESLPPTAARPRVTIQEVCEAELDAKFDASKFKVAPPGSSLLPPGRSPVPGGPGGRGRGLAHTRAVAKQRDEQQRERILAAHPVRTVSVADVERERAAPARPHPAAATPAARYAAPERGGDPFARVGRG